MQTAKIDCDILFFEAVSQWLANASMTRCPGHPELKVISGDLVQPNYQARISIVFCPSRLKKEVPKVYCDEPWIRCDLDWHCLKIQGQGGNQQMCWIHPLEWLWANNHPLKKVHTVILEGSEWLKNNVAKLLDCHWVGHVLEIKNWRAEWGGWAHGDLGTKEFFSEKKAHGLPNNWIATSFTPGPP